MSDRYICIHGHFYQPPRENPWLEDIEVQDSAYPFHDWNERIAEECYAPNSASRLLDDKQRISEIINNYLRISFNFGPTLLTWMAQHTPDLYQKILESDRLSLKDRSGHGNALAQVYNHIIMPLASRRDKVTQVEWGIQDFYKRFGRAPEGMWLAETAVDSETLEVLAEKGLKFTILSPHQAKRVRPLGSSTDHWQDVSGGGVDPSCAYRWISPRGHAIDLFFYDSPISRAIAFEGLLANGEVLTQRLLSGFSENRHRPQLVNVATDGETFGHHHRFGDMALAYALNKLQKENLAVLTNYGEFLSKHPSQWGVEIVENSSWSCFHGVERWRSDCGCRIGHHSQWNQQWRKPLREALDQLRDSLDKLYEDKARQFLKDPWAARNGYIDVLYDRSPPSLDRFFEQHQVRPLELPDRVAVLKLMEMQRHRLYMFTSCGWFFDDISGLESVTILLSAGRALQIAQSFPEGSSLEKRFLDVLSQAKSNIPEMGNGAAVYQKFVRPMITDLSRIAAHQAIRGLFQEEPEEGKIYCYSHKYLDRKTAAAHGNSLCVGRMRITSDITLESLDTAFAVLYVGGQDFHGVLKAFPDLASYTAVKKDLLHELLDGTLTGTLAHLGQHFGRQVYSLQDLLLEDRRRILQSALQDVLRRFDGTYRLLVDENRKLIDYLTNADFPMPPAFRFALQYVLEQDMKKVLDNFQEDSHSLQRLLAVQKEASRFNLTLDWTPAADMIRGRMEGHLEALYVRLDPERAKRILMLLDLADKMSIKPSLWRLENLFYDLWNHRVKKELIEGEADLAPFIALADRLRFKTEIPAPV